VQDCSRGVLVVVADGAGGLPGGARAAEMLIDAVRQPGSSLYAGTGAAELSDLLRLADARIAAHPAAGETTGLAVFVSEGYVVGASVGDSEAWVVSRDRIHVLTAKQIRRRAGSGAASPIAFEERFVDGRLVVGTDGLFGYADEAGIAHVLRSCDLSECPEKLLSLVRIGGDRYADDVALAVVG
jgi:serine/threonine protein phosphatase PrpC